MARVDLQLISPQKQWKFVAAELQQTSRNETMSNPPRRLFQQWTLQIGVGMLAFSALSMPAFGAQQSLLALACTNVVSGTGWQLTVDLKAGTVDSNPARISNNEISWHDPDGGHYTLDRRTGDLTAIFPSSTGGYFIHHHCAPRN